MSDWSSLISLGLEWAPAFFIVLLAAMVTWLVWRMLRRLFGFIGGKHESAPVPPPPQPVQERREPMLGSAAPTVSTIPDAADVLALKASIDALTRQIAALEKRLAPAAPEMGDRPSPKGAEVIPIIEPVVSSDRRKG